jgi:cysteinyl-tRNA synthetase
MKVFNTLGRELQEFKPLHGKKVGMYSCGPTVYGLPHIGNFRSFFFADMIHRYLEYRGYEVNWVMNVTDIDDKTIRDSIAANMTLKDFTEKYAKVFLDGLEALHINRPDVLPRATQHVPEMIALIEKLVEKGIAYQVGGSVYYSVRKFPDYGKLSQVDLSGLEAGHRVDVDEYEKDEPSDFALWKASSQDEIARGIFFDTPWGKGKPGWHIECSAMSTKYLGQPFDIHTGGVDLVFPHHENEIAQSEGANGQQMVKYWLHGAHLVVDGAKMSKSKGNWFTLTDLLAKFDADSIRYFFLETHYRQQLNYTNASIENARLQASKALLALENLDFFIENAGAGDAGELDGAIAQRKREFTAAMDSDFDSPAALRAIHALASDVYKYVEKGKSRKALEKARGALNELLGVLGLFERRGKASVPAEVKALVKERDAARKAKDFKKADALRDAIKAKGFLLDDFTEGTRARKA